MAKSKVVLAQPEPVSIRRDRPQNKRSATIGMLGLSGALAYLTIYSLSSITPAAAADDDRRLLFAGGAPVVEQSAAPQHPAVAMDAFAALDAEDGFGDADFGAPMLSGDDDAGGGWGADTQDGFADAASSRPRTGRITRGRGVPRD